MMKEKKKKVDIFLVQDWMKASAVYRWTAMLRLSLKMPNNKLPAEDCVCHQTQLMGVAMLNINSV